MATIPTTAGSSVYQLEKWLGLNESPDGDTALKAGEAAVMRNFRVTREGHLQIRPGYAPVCALAEGSPVRGLWSGYVAGKAHLLAACGGRLWDVDAQAGAAEDLGALPDGPCSFFGFANNVYLLTGQGYFVWDGQGEPAPVEGYVPVVVTAAPPEGGGQLLERANRLTGKKRARYSPDGSAKLFQLPETDLDELLAVEGTALSYTVNLAAGTVSFSSAPEKGVNTLTFTWRKGDGDRARIEGMRFAEVYNGSADTRVFLYGDGTNECVYSDLDENGRASAEYFPELNTVAVDSANTPVTALIRHYSQLAAFKSDSAYSIQYGSLTLADGTVTAGFYVTPVHRAVGNEAMGQAQLVANDPWTLFGRGAYQWTLSAGALRDERRCKRVSDRVEDTLAGFDLGACVTFDDEQRQELYIVCGDQALVHNYGGGVWYFYDHFPARCFAAAGGEVYFGAPDGRVMHLSRRYRNDDLEPIDAWWESGALDFGQDWRRKHSAMLWVSLKPESQARVTVTHQSDRGGAAEKEVWAGLSTFGNASFAHWSFATNRKPRTRRVKLRLHRFAIDKLILSSRSASATATVLGCGVRVRTAGKVW